MGYLARNDGAGRELAHERVTTAIRMRMNGHSRGKDSLLKTVDQVVGKTQSTHLLNLSARAFVNVER